MPRSAPESLDTDLAILASTPGSALNTAVAPINSDGVPGSGDFADGLYIGRQAVDTNTGKVYVCTATDGETTSTWALVGGQTA